MRIQATHHSQPRRVYPDTGALKLKDAELYFDSVVIGEAITLADLETLLEEANMPEYNGVLVEQQTLACLVEEALTSEEHGEIATWAAWTWVPAGTQRLYGSQVYECLQSHVTQTGWEPHLTPALWRKIETPPEEGEEPEIPLWKMPEGAHDAYSAGDKVWYPDVGGDIWISKMDGNTTIPDDDVPYNRFWEIWKGE